MKYSLEDELVAGEISFLKPRLSKRRAFVEALIGALVIVVFVSFMIWFASIFWFASI